jgi:autophagy-related protein 2
LVHDPGGATNAEQLESHGKRAEHLPTTVDLAQSFLQTEPAKERADLQAALSKSQYAASPHSSEDVEESLNTGLGTGLSLPAFIADFLKGVGDRLRLDIRKVKLDVDMKLELPSSVSAASTNPSSLEKLTLRLTVDNIEINELIGDSADTERGDSKVPDDKPKCSAYRKIRFSNLRCSIISDPSLFSSASHLSGTPSPVATQSSLQKPRAAVNQDGSLSKSLASSSDLEPGTLEPMVLTAEDTPSRSTSRWAQSQLLRSTLEDAANTAPDSASSSNSDLGSTSRFPQMSNEDLTQSMLFSHDESASLYQSAFSQAVNSTTSDLATQSRLSGPTSRTHYPYSKAKNEIDRPGKVTARFGSYTTTGMASGIASNAAYDNNPINNDPNMRSIPSVENPLTWEKGIPPTSESISGDESHNSMNVDSFQGSPRTAKQIFLIESLTVNLPSYDSPIASSGPALDASTNTVRKESGHSGLPGAFSKFEISQLVTGEVDGTLDSSKPETIEGLAQSLGGYVDPVSILLQDVSVVGDMSLTRVLIVIIQQFSSLQSRASGPAEYNSDPQHASLKFDLKIENFGWKFVDVVRGYTDDSSGYLESSAPGSRSPTDAETLLLATFKELDLSYKIEGTFVNTDISIGKFEFGYIGERILAFDSGFRMRESNRDVLPPVDKDMVITIQQDCDACSINVTTLPLHVTLDLARLDETFAWFGGLSTVLGLGSSMMSTVTVLEPKAKTLSGSKRTRGVHFEASAGATSSQVPNPTLKLTVRVGSLRFDVLGRESSLRLESSAIKLVSRTEGVGVQLDKMKFTGPYVRQNYDEPAATLRMSNIRIEYLPIPKEVDLSRLLALLSPSKDRDEEDNDILLDTLFRQRRQGGVVRLTVEATDCNISKLDELDHLKLISEELSKLSSVAKYLPEDDRPGILSLILLRKLSLQAHVNANVGSIEMISHDIEVAHVSFPSLILMGIKNLQVKHAGNILLGEALVLDVKSEQLSPMIMARLIGDEMEPTLKFKLQNLRLEYHVSTLMAILGISENDVGDGMVSDLVHSVRNLAELRPPPKLASQSSVSSARSSTGRKRTNLEVKIRDSIVGLNPRLSVSKGLLVLSDAKIVCNLPNVDETELGGAFSIKKASIMIIDDVSTILHGADTSDGIVTTNKRTQVQSLANMGYVGVSEVSAAKITWRLTSQGKGSEKSIDVEIRDDLFVLETCADSTKTLQEIFDGLNPPMPPSQEVKYRTEVVPVEDMLASFTGDAYLTEDMHHSHESETGLNLDESDFLDNEMPQNLEFVSSYYDSDTSRKTDSSPNINLDNSEDSLASSPVQNPKREKRLPKTRDEVALKSEPLQFDENYFGSGSRTDGAFHKWSSDRNTYDLGADRKARGSPLHLRIRDLHIIWNLFDGYDWQRTRDAIGQAVAEVETKAAERMAQKDKRKSLNVEDEEEAVIGDFLFNSIYIGVPANRDPRELSRRINRDLDDLTSEADSYATSTTAQGSPSRQTQKPALRRKRLRLNRSKHHKMTFELKGVSADLVVFPPSSGETQNSIDVRIQDLEIFDHVPTSTWKKFATYMHDAGERESGSNMVHIEILTVRPVPELAATEMILKATVLPLRLHVDQDALDFMTRFFEFKDESARMPTSTSEAAFFQRAEVNAVQVKLDFKPKRVDYAGIRSGHTTEFMNFFILDQADMVLRHVIIYGVSGFDKLGKTLNDIWMPDIKRNQLPGVLAGLAPVRSIVNVGGGVKDLVLIPIREYKKDGRVIRSIQKGAFSFAKTTTTELAKLGAKLALGTQTVLQGAEDYLVRPSPPQRLDNWEDADLEEDDKEQISLYADQPIGIMQGLRGAYRHLERDLLMAKDAIIAIPGEVMESKTAGGAAKAVLRSAPTVILRPALGVTKAVGQTLLGATNTLDKGERRRVEDVSHSSKYFQMWND